MADSTKNQGMLAYAAPNFLQPHKARQAIRDAHEKKIPPLLFWYAGISSVPLIRFIAPLGFDGVWIDWEHTPCGVETMTEMVQSAIFMSGGRTMPFVRVPGPDHASIGWALDAGASIVVPQVETVEQARHIVSSAKFGVKNSNGSRSAPPFRYFPGLTDQIAYPERTNSFWESLNQQAAIMIQIESKLGVENLDEILTECPEIDIVWLGTLDCRVSMSLPDNRTVGMKGDEKEWVELVDLFERTLKKHDKPRGGFSFMMPPVGTKETFKKAVEEYALLCVSADVTHLGWGMMGDLQNCKGVIAEMEEEKKAAKEKENGKENRNGEAGVVGAH
ncbi:HpcH/HpaI aldolase/citrate lyase [Naviculisporaceae sp. PSN 640]